MTKRLGYIGVGLMGKPMIERLLDANHEVTIWNRTRKKIVSVLGKGAVEARSVADLVSRVDIVFMCLTDSMAVERVVFDKEGVSSAGSKGKLLVDFSSMRPDLTKELAARLYSQTGMHWVDAPVSGGTKGAKNGTLAIMAGGSEEDIECIRPIVEAFSQRFTHMGELGAGQVAKLCNQIIVGSNITLRGLLIGN